LTLSQHLRFAGASVAMTLDDVFLLTAFKAVEEHSVGLSRRETGNDSMMFNR